MSAAESSVSGAAAACPVAGAVPDAEGFGTDSGEDGARSVDVGFAARVAESLGTGAASAGGVEASGSIVTKGTVAVGLVVRTSASGTVASGLGTDAALSTPAELGVVPEVMAPDGRGRVGGRASSDRTYSGVLSGLLFLR
ncbi:hypothetical protein GCM10009539_54630 [Cryptosporangium japonicum]|uniref:Uncharacterized protein n=1 Tax=Cryptosporangium japonicum TaxID=80872 RepID=A0ABN0UUK6_9ACTN